MPFFSIVLITYNRAALLPRCIESVINQTFDNWELVVVDNHSTDGSIELINAYIEKEPRIRLLLVHNNNVLSVSRNAGIRESKGKYICILDSDDWYYNNKLERVYNACVETGCDFLYHKMRAVSTKGEEGFLSQRIDTNNPFLDILMNGNRICNSSAVIKKDALNNIGLLSEDPTISEDTDCWLRLGLDNCVFYFLDECLGCYWVGDNMSGSLKHLELTRNVYNKYLPYVPDELKSKVATRLDYIIALKYYKMGMRKESISLFYKVCKRADYKTRLKSIIYISKNVFNIKFRY